MIYVLLTLIAISLFTAIGLLIHLRKMLNNAKELEEFVQDLVDEYNKRWESNYMTQPCLYHGEKACWDCIRDSVYET